MFSILDSLKDRFSAFLEEVKDNWFWDESIERRLFYLEERVAYLEKRVKELEGDTEGKFHIGDYIGKWIS